MPVAKIETIIRQKDDGLRRAVVETIQREHEKAIELVGPRVEEIPKRMDRLRAVAKAYLEISADERMSALVVTPANADGRCSTT